MGSARVSLPATNEQLKTYGKTGMGRDYVEGQLSNWEADFDTNHVADNESDVLECYDDQASFDDQAVIANSTNDATRFRIIRAASGQGHDGTSNNGFFFKSTADDDLFELIETHSQLQDFLLQLSITGSTTRISMRYRTLSDGNVCIGLIDFDSAVSAANAIPFKDQLRGNVGFVLCLAENSDFIGFNIDESTGADFVYSCMAIDNANDGFQLPTGSTCVFKNCLATGNGTDFDGAGTTTNSANCADGDGTTSTLSGAGHRASQTFTFVNAGGNDYHLADGDVGAKDFGTDLSGDGTFDFDDDINKGAMGGKKAGESFSTNWDIGFDEPNPVAAGDQEELHPVMIAYG